MYNLLELAPWPGQEQTVDDNSIITHLKIMLINIFTN